MRRRATVVIVVLACLASALRGVAPVGAAERHSGTVTGIDPSARTVVVRELVEDGRARSLEIEVAQNARLVFSERTINELAPDKLGPFVDTPIQFSDLRRGDFVIVEGTPQGKRLLASTLTVTLRPAP